MRLVCDSLLVKPVEQSAPIVEITALKNRHTLATPRNTRRILLRISIPTKARLICRETTATSSTLSCTDGKSDSAWARRMVSTSVFVRVRDGSCAREGKTMFNIAFETLLGCSCSLKSPKVSGDVPCRFCTHSKQRTAFQPS